MTGESIPGRGYAIDPHGCSLNAQKKWCLASGDLLHNYMEYPL